MTTKNQLGANGIATGCKIRRGQTFLVEVRQDRAKGLNAIALLPTNFFNGE